VTSDYGYLGCSANVLDLLDRSCSGQHTCKLGVPTLRDLVQPCPKDLTSYLDVTYRCVSGNKYCSSWDGRPFGHNRRGRNIGGCASYGAGWNPYNTMCPGLRPTFVPSGILIIEPLGHNRHGPKIGEGALPFGGGAGFTS